MAFAINSSDVIALLALAVSAYAALKTVNFNDRQKSMIESQERLNKLLLQKEEDDATSEKKADPRAAIIKLGTTQYRLRIWNQGKCPAKDVRVSFPEGNEIVSSSELEEKLPMERLDTHQSLELMAWVHMQTKGKHAVLLTWSDDSNNHNEKTIYVTL